MKKKYKCKWGDILCSLVAGAIWWVLADLLNDDDDGDCLVGSEDPNNNKLGRQAVG